MTIDEAIEQERDGADIARGNIIKFNNLDGYESWNNSECIKCAEEHEQIAKWLEELKAYREIGTVEECRNSVLDIEREYNKGYADGSLSVTEEIRGKAIDDFCTEIEKEYDNDYCPNVSDYLDYKISLRDLFNIAEQLKECGKNE